MLITALVTAEVFALITVFVYLRKLTAFWFWLFAGLSLSCSAAAFLIILGIL